MSDDLDGMDREEIETLGRYNAERSRGLTHDSEYAERMEQLQRRFDARMAQLDTDAAYVTQRARFTIVYPRPRWRRLLRLPAKREVRGPYVVEPWPKEWRP